jgi:biotin operon repressor
MYQRSFEIERRLSEVLRLVRAGRYSTPLLAEELGVSIPTVSRYVTALRERGYNISSQRKNGRWCYVLVEHALARGTALFASEAGR